MKLIIYTKYILALMSLAVGLQSCGWLYEYDNCPPEGEIAIHSDWTACPGADPEGMAYIFFPSGDEVPWRFDFPGRNGGTVKIPNGSYSMISYNDDTRNVRFEEGNGYDGYVAYTEPADPIAFPDSEPHKAAKMPEKIAASGTPLVKSPDMMWGASDFLVDISDESIEYGYICDGDTSNATSYDKILTVYQRQLTAKYSFVVRDVKNLDGVRHMSAVFSGMAGSMNLASGQKLSYPVMIPVKATKRGDDMVEGSFFTFGLPEKPYKANILTLLVQLKDGRKYEYDFDVTKQVRTAPAPLNVFVEIRGLDIAESGPSDDGGAFDVSLDGWISITINFNT